MRLAAYASMLKLDMLGLLSIAAGALDRGQALARDYAGIRKQGGKVIGEHPAVSTCSVTWRSLATRLTWR
ncbi:MAG: hypothetical protein IPO19_12815 [Rhodoferax sp.]|nr:hypothetical protein [Rhodoferax sp.]